MENMYDEKENIIKKLTVEKEALVQRYKKEIDEKNKIVSLHENNIRTLKLDVNEKNNSIGRFKDEIEEKNRELSKRRFQLIICFVLIAFFILLSVFFKLSESKREVIEEINPTENVVAALPAKNENEEDKKEIQEDKEIIEIEISTPEEIVSIVPSVPKEVISIIPSLPTPEKEEVKPAEAVKTEDIKITKPVPPKPKKLVYSEDEVYTKLIWKGYRGENAIYEFQRDNGMPQTGRIDEKLLNKLGIKPRFK